jgi:hypothetical protein
VLHDFTFPLPYLSEKFGAPIESIAKSHDVHCDKENLASTFFGKIRKRRRVPRNQDRPDKWPALSDCSGPSRCFADKVREIASRIELNLPHARPFGARLREQNIETANLSGPSPNGDDAGGAALSVSGYQSCGFPTGPRARNPLAHRGEQSPYTWRLLRKARRYVSTAISREPAIRRRNARGA